MEAKRKVVEFATRVCGFLDTARINETPLQDGQVRQCETDN